MSCEAREVREHVYTDPLCKIGTNFGAGGVLSWYSLYIYLLAPTAATAGGARGLTPASGGVRTQALHSSHPDPRATVNLRHIPQRY